MELGEIRGIRHWSVLLGARTEPWLRSVSGIWRVGEGNVLVLQDRAAFWNGMDTFFWSGGQGLQVQPLEKSFCGDRAVEPAINLAEMTDLEAEEAISSFLGDSTPPSATGLDPLEAYSVRLWDVVTGDMDDEPARFDSLRSSKPYERWR